jgi:hypothetical protein
MKIPHMKIPHMKIPHMKIPVSLALKVKQVLAGIVVTMVAQSALLATTVAISESSGTVEIYLASGTQVTAAYVLPGTSTAIGNNMAFRFGTFTGNFTPTTNNVANWFSNFVGVNGYVAVGSTSSGRLTASITAGDLQVINAPVSSNTGVGADGSKSIAKDAQMYAIVWNAAYTSNGSGGNVFNPAATGLQAGIFTNPGWLMPTSGSLDPSSTTFSLSSGTVALSGLGSVDLANKGLTMALIPEPSVFSLVVASGSILMALRVRRGVKAKVL